MDKGWNKKLIDIHAHILPGVDDGARTMEEACALVKQIEGLGFGAVIATPHYSRRRGSDGYAELAEQLQEEIEKTSPGFRIFLGQETFFYDELAERLKEGKALSMAGSRYVLVEFDTTVSFQTINRAIRRLITARYIPIIAHMERYGCLRERDNLEEFYQSGCLTQMNYESLQGFGLHPEIRWCRKQVLDGRIHFLGTDMHRTDYRPPKISAALKWLNSHVDEELVDDMTYGNAIRMMNNERIS